MRNGLVILCRSPKQLRGLGSSDNMAKVPAQTLITGLRRATTTTPISLIQASLCTKTGKSCNSSDQSARRFELSYQSSEFDEKKPKSRARRFASYCCYYRRNRICD